MSALAKNDYSGGNKVLASELNGISDSANAGQGALDSLNAGETLAGATTPVPVYQNTSDNELYACDANDTSKLKFIGFVTTSSTDGNPIEFHGSGLVDGFTGLTEGAAYYVQDTAGTIGTTPGTYKVKVGVAISTTTLLIQPGARYAAGNYSFSQASGSGDANYDETINVGFRIEMLKMEYFIQGTTASSGYEQKAGVAMFDCNGNVLYNYVYQQDTGGTDNLLPTNIADFVKNRGTGAVTAGANSNQGMLITVTIVNVTGTSFDIRKAIDEGPSALSTARLQANWEAWGDF